MVLGKQWKVEAGGPEIWLLQELGETVSYSGDEGSAVQGISGGHSKLSSGRRSCGKANRARIMGASN